MLRRKVNPEQHTLDEITSPLEKRVALGHGQGVAIDMRNKVQDDTLDGEVVAIMEFPGTPDVPSKRVALVDYGENFNDKHLVPEAPSHGRPQSRYGLMTLNYVPVSHLLVYAPFPANQRIVLGLQEVDSNISYLLGLDQQDSGNEAISGQHVSIIHDNQTLHITDISRNGTIVEYQA